MRKTSIIGLGSAGFAGLVFVFFAEIETVAVAK
jgi:hypothetical protein